jgi:hypothetical protein
MSAAQRDFGIVGSMYNFVRYLQFLLHGYLSRAGISDNGFRHQLQRPRENSTAATDEPPDRCGKTVHRSLNTSLRAHVPTPKPERELQTRRSGTVAFESGRWLVDHSLFAFVHVSVKRGGATKSSHCVITWRPSKLGLSGLTLKVSTQPNGVLDGQGAWKLLMSVSKPDNRTGCQK